MDKLIIIDKNVNLFIENFHLKTTNFDQREFFIDFTFFEMFRFLFLRSVDPTGKFETDAWIERILIIGYPKNPNRLTIHSGLFFDVIEIEIDSIDSMFLGDKQAVPFHNYQETSQTLLIRRPGPSVHADWTLTIA